MIRHVHVRFIPTSRITGPAHFLLITPSKNSYTTPLYVNRNQYHVNTMRVILGLQEGEVKEVVSLLVDLSKLLE